MDANRGCSSVYDPDGLAENYIDLLKKHLTRGIYRAPQPQRRSLRWMIYRPIGSLLARQGLQLVRTLDPAECADGRQYSSEAETMIGLRRLDNLHHCIRSVVQREIPGDLIETGVWRGGATIFMRGVLKAYDDSERTVWVADSFQGLPKPNPDAYPVDAGDKFWTMSGLAVSLEVVRANFAQYNLLDDRVQFLPGWFRDTLGSAPFDQLAILRLDGDMYESTMDALTALYPKLSVGGYVIIDDFGVMSGCQAAVRDFRAEHGIDTAIEPIDASGVFWQRKG
jgi:O-methyltransferase